MDILLQLHGGRGSGGSTQQIKSSAPGSTQVATIDGATADERQKYKEQLAKARGRSYTDKTNGVADANMRKQLLGE